MPSIGRFWVKHPAIDLYQAILKPEEKNHKESEQYENKNVKNQHFFKNLFLFYITSSSLTN
jgi:hypothetical protein